MAETNLKARWDELEKGAHEALDIDMSVGASRADWHLAARKTLTAFLAELYADHWRHVYTVLGLDLPDTLSVLKARSMEVHHWPPTTTAEMTVEELLTALAQDISHCPYPAQAIRVIEFGLGDLPERHDVVDHLRAQADRQQSPA